MKATNAKFTQKLLEVELREHCEFSMESSATKSQVGSIFANPPPVRKTH